MVAVVPKMAARQRAKQQRILLDAERERRDAEREQAAAGYFELSDKRDLLREKIADVEVEMSLHVRTLLGLGEKLGRVAIFLDTSAEEVRRLRALGDARPSSGSVDSGSIPVA